DVVDAAGAPVATVAEGGPATIRAVYRLHQRVPAAMFQVAIIDADTGLVVATATSSATASLPEPGATSTVDCTFEAPPVPPRQDALRLAITDARQLMSYDLVSAGPRFVVTSAGGRRQPTDDDAGVVSLPYRFDYPVRAAS